MTQLAQRDAKHQIDDLATDASGDEAFRAYVVDRLRATNLEVTPHITRGARLAFGDIRITHRGSVTDLKIQFDRELAESDNLRIPVDDPFGLLSAATFRWFGVGNYRFLWIIDRIVLQREIRQHTTAPHSSQRGHGFLLQRTRATDIARRVFFWDDRYADGQHVEPVDPAALLRSIGEAAFGIKYDKDSGYPTDK